MRRAPWFSALSIAAYCVGVLARWRYILGIHHPRNNVDTDDVQLAKLAQLLLEPNGHQLHVHTIWPPGMASFLAANVAFDPTLGTAASCQFLASAAIPLIVARTAHIAFGRRAAWVALAMASLHVGFIHYCGLFLSEGLFTLAVTVAIWQTVAALAAQSTPRLAVQGLASGLAWGLAFALRPNALPVAVFIGGWLVVRWLRQRRWKMGVALAPGILGLALVFVPLAHRCTVLVGHFCPGASNGAMNVALGHAPTVAGLHFKPRPDDHRVDVDTTWLPPAKFFHGPKGIGEVDGTIYESGPSLEYVAHQIRRAPIQFVVDSVGNVLDLFGIADWPDDYSPVNKRRVIVAKQLFLFLVLVPGVFMWAASIRRMVVRHRTTDIDAFLVAGVAGLFLTAAATMGEARYRVPFDAFFIVFAARAIALRAPLPADATRPAPLRGTPFLTAGVLAALALAIVLIAHPSFALGPRLSAALGEPARARKVAARLSLSALSMPHAEGTPWDAPGSFRFTCNPTCPELQLDLEGPSHAPTIEVSLDHNDRYECSFLRQGSFVGKVSWPIVENAVGVSVVRSAVPAEAVAAGYDELVLRPLYGDGAYAVGHVRVF